MKCTRCEAYKNPYKINCEPFHGNPQAEILFVGEASGKTEVDGKLLNGVLVPFIGKAGKVLDELLSDIHLTRKDVAVTNACKCYIQDNEKPNRKILDACFPYLYFEIQKIKPKLIVALGETAFYALTGKNDFHKYIGRLMFSDKIKNNVYPVYHPAAIFYDGSKIDSLKDMFMEIPHLLDSKPVSIKNYEYKLIDSVKKLYQVLPILEESEVLLLDTETTGLSPYRDTLRIVQIGTEKDPKFIITKEVFEKCLDDLNPILKKAKIVGQGVIDFDFKFLNVKYGTDFAVIWDTMLAEYIISGVGNNDLTTLTWKYAPESGGYDEETYKAGGAHKVFDMGKLCQYGANDIGVLPIIKKKQEEQINANEKWPFLLHNILIPCDKSLTKMSIRGLRYDLEKVDEWDKHYKKLADGAFNQVRELEGVKECSKWFRESFNPRSSAHIKWLLLDYYKLPVLKKTDPSSKFPEGAPSIGKVEMARYAEQGNEYCELMQFYRAYQAVRKNFFSGVLPKLDDGVAHTNYSIHSVASGRSNSRDPNLLNLTREAKSCIIPRDGMIFLKADEGQLEVRVASVIYYDEDLISYCNNVGEDLHSLITSSVPELNVWKLSYEDFRAEYEKGNLEVTKARKNGKAVVFGVIYGEGADGLSYNLNTTKSTAQGYIDGLFQRFTGLASGIEKQKQFTIETGIAETYFGLQRRWKYHAVTDTNTAREAVNHVIQGSAWQLVQLAIIEIDKQLEMNNYDAALVMQVHDEIIIECSEQCIDEVAELLQRTMININYPFDMLNDVSLVTDVVVCRKNLADSEKVW